jgi:hypothetical protein
VKQTTNAACSATRRRPPLTLIAAAVGLALGGCANDNVPSAPSTAPSPPVMSSTLPAEPQPATLNWARSICQTLHPAFDRLGTPPQPDLGNLATTRQTYINYLGNARSAAQQAIDRLPAVGAPPVDNGQQVLDNLRDQLIQLHKDLDDALVKLNQANPNDVGATGLALGAAGNVLGALGNRVQVLGNLMIDPHLRAAINQTPECQSLIATNTTTATSQPTESPQPTR